MMWAGIVIAWLSMLVIAFKLGRTVEDISAMRKKMNEKSEKRDEQQQLSREQIADWAARNGVWVVSPAESIGLLSRAGYVVVAPDQWQQMVTLLDKARQPSMREWLQREDEK